MPSVGIELHATTVNREPLRISEREPAGRARARYVLGRPLAQGGMAALYLGQRIVCSAGPDGASGGGFVKQVVLKRLRSELSQNRDALALFWREAELAASLDHPAIVRAFDLTEIEGTPYLVMEYVRGGDLRLVLRRAKRRNQRFSAAAGLYIGRELCAALAYTHARCLPGDGAARGQRPLGLVHRDISPTNILLSADGEVKLTDFGIAQAETADASHAGSSSEPRYEPRARGHVGYMSPEQARGEALDARSDLFSLGAVLYEVFTDRRLFVGLVGQPAAEVYGQGMPPPPSQLCPELPLSLDTVLLRALALPASERPRSASVLYQQLDDIARQSGLFMDRAEFAAHLAEVCGADPAEWASIEERTSTALIAQISSPGFDGLDGIADHDEPSGLIEKASAMSVAEPSEPAITVPWPTVAVERSGFGVDFGPDSVKDFGSGVPIVESDDTQPFPSGKVSLPGPISRHAPRLSADADEDAVTGPAPRTLPEKLVEKLIEKAPEKLPEKLPAKLPEKAPEKAPLLLAATTAQHLAMPISLPHNRPAARIFGGDRGVGFAYGLIAGLVAGVVVCLLAWALSGRGLF